MVIAETSGQALIIRPSSSASSDGNGRNRVIIIDSVLRPDQWLP